MDNRKSEGRMLAESAQAAAMHCRAVEQLINRYVARTTGCVPPTSVRTDCEKYRWIRGNRGNFAIDEAIRLSDRDKDFDDRITAAMGHSAPATAPMPVHEATARRRTRIYDIHEHKRPPDHDRIGDLPSRTQGFAQGGMHVAVIGRFDKDSASILFCVWIAGTAVHASVSAAVLRVHYASETAPMALFERNSSALAEAVHDRVAGGSVEPIVLREYDLK